MHPYPAVPPPRWNTDPDVAARTAGTLGAVSIALGLGACLAAGAFGIAAPHGVTVFFAFSLVFIGCSGLALLISGTGALGARSHIRARRPWTPQAAKVRTLVLGMWLCTVVGDALGCLIIAAVLGASEYSTPLPVAIAVGTIVVALATTTCGGLVSFKLRRRLPRA
ncbi:hypothetical protein [Amycolatopsis sp. PS_44_ISF1]|uniref:hypothetical protein n=1 Tax=Amycolatopsis sp. PS_44_ISF1 TaxID=2974917 RepID=UPI0028DF8FBA|nr:hypothetical protein [Amycolatopsis sp. PS_44_ISF1]MDT8909571.1 hypothetical protein [Amycolatopsis sp. PS_44_ISF1]